MTSPLKLRESQYGENEPKSIIYNGELIKASCFGGMEIFKSLEDADLSKKDLIIFWNAYNELKSIFGTNNGKKLRHSGEPYYQHPKAVMLILFFELGIVDINQLIAGLHHDSPEDSLLMRGNLQHPRQELQEIKTKITTFDCLNAKYNKIIAKMLMALAKRDREIDKLPQNLHEQAKKNRDTMLRKNPEEFKKHLFQYFNQLINLYPELRIEIVRIKIADRVHNFRTAPQGHKIIKRDESGDEFSARKLVETLELFMPIVEKIFTPDTAEYQLIIKEINDSINLLTPTQISNLEPAKYKFKPVNPLRRLISKYF